MAEPLVIQFAADTSRAQSAMNTLASQIVGNMASIGVAMSGGAANSNGFGAALGNLQNNAQRAASAVGRDVRNIASATANAATADKATLEGVIRAFTASAAGSQTAATTVKTGLTSTAAAVQGVVSQIPSLTTLVGAFIAFEAAKIVFDSVSASIDAAREHVEEFTKIGKDAERVGVGTGFFQRATLDAKALGLETQQVVAALTKAREAGTVRIGEGDHGSNTSSFANRLEQNVKAGNLSAADRSAFTGAETQEAKIRVVLDLIDKLRAQGRDLAAFDLAGKFFGSDFEQRLRDGVELTRRLREQLDSKAQVVGGVRVVDPEEVQRATELDTKLTDIRNTFATALLPVQRDFSESALNIYRQFLDFEAALGRAAIVASNLYVELSKIPGALDATIPSAGKLATLLGAVEFGKATGLDKLGSTITDAATRVARAAGIADAIGLPREGETQAQANDRNGLQAARDLLRDRLKQPGAVSGAVEASNKLDFRPKPEVKPGDRSAVLPSLSPKRGRDSSESDPVETFINGLEKSAAAAKAEAEAFNKSNVEKRIAIELAKAREIASQNGRTLTDAETASITKAATEVSRYKDQLQDLEQAQRQMADAARFFGSALSDSFADAILEGRSLTDVVSNLSKQISRSLITAVFTGQGPLAGLLGTAPSASQGSNAVGGLAGLLTSAFGSASSSASDGQGSSAAAGGIGSFFANLFRANGGPVEAGQAYTVGERGRELFVPNANGQIVPIVASGSGGAPSYTDARTISIDATGSTMSEGQMRAIFVQVLAQSNAERDRTQDARDFMARRGYR